MKQFGILLCTVLLVLITACGGGGPRPARSAFSQLNFTMVTNPASSVQAQQVSGQYVDLTHNDFSWVSGQLPTGSTPVAGMQFSPSSPPGSGFSGVLSAVLDTEKGTSALVANRRVNVYRADAAGRNLVRYSAVTTGSDGSFLLPLNFLGLIVFASSLPGEEFTVAAFADQSTPAVGTAVNFRAFTQNAVGAVMFDWDFGDGGTAQGETVTHSYMVPGAYSVSLLARDSAGNTAPAVSTAIVVTASANPLTAVSVVVSRGGARNSFTFDYAATTTGGTAPFTYDWEFDLATPGSDTQTTTVGVVNGKVFADPRSYSGRVIVTDALGQTVTSPIFESDNRLVPFITLIVPGEAERGETVEIQGDSFGLRDGNDQVLLGGITCPIDLTPGKGWTDTSIFVVIPPTAVNGDFVVQTEVASNAVPFRVIPPAPGMPDGGQF
jgi:PKD repeat protein